MQIGAILLAPNGTVLSRTSNEVEQSSDPTAHAEMLAIREGAALLGNWRLNGCTLYTTCEPCAMCLSALQLARVKRVVYGTQDRRLGGVESCV